MDLPFNWTMALVAVMCNDDEECFFILSDPLGQLENPSTTQAALELVSCELKLMISFLLTASVQMEQTAFLSELRESHEYDFIHLFHLNLMSSEIYNNCVERHDEY